MPGAFTARSVRTGRPHAAVSAIGEAAIALQLMPDTCRRRTAAVIPNAGEE